VIRRLPFAVCRLPFAVCRSPFAVRRSHGVHSYEVRQRNPSCRTISPERVGVKISPGALPPDFTEILYEHRITHYDAFKQPKAIIVGFVFLGFIEQWPFGFFWGIK
jgi:hypothetical protein